MKKFILLYFAIVGILAGQSKVGTTGAPFLNIAVGPRAISMGSAFVGTANDVTSLFYNPAGAARMQTSGAFFSHSKWIADISYNWAGAVFNMSDMGALGLSVTYLNIGEMEVTTMNEPEGTGEMFTPYGLSFALSYSYNLTDRFSIGGTVKYVSEQIYHTSANAVAADLGVLFTSDIYGLRIGAAIQNFGTDMQLDGKDLYVQHDIDDTQYGNNDQILARLNTDSYPLPLVFRIGIAMDVLDLESHRFTLGVDALHPNDNSESLNLGAEYTFYNLISFRGGYKSLFLDNTDEEGLTLGVGLSYDFAPRLGLSFDYAYQDFNQFKETQHFSLGIKF